MLPSKHVRGSRLPATSCENSSCCTPEDLKITPGGRSNVLPPQSGPHPRQHRPVSVWFSDLDESPQYVRQFTEMRCVRQTVLKPMRRNGRLVLKELKSSSKGPPDYWQSYQAIHPLGNTRRRSRHDDDNGGAKSRHRWSVELGSLPPLILYLSPSDTSSSEDIDRSSSGGRRSSPDGGKGREGLEELTHHKSRVLLRSASLPVGSLVVSKTNVYSGATASRSRLATDLEGLVSAAAKTIDLYRPRKFGAPEAMELEMQINNNSGGCREAWDGFSNTRILRSGKTDVIRQ